MFNKHCFWNVITYIKLAVKGPPRFYVESAAAGRLTLDVAVDDAKAMQIIQAQKRLRDVTFARRMV